ncbi:MAG: hypothetical protein NXI32_05480 [bacterium]|nr:hypothetical protein [bacterium]
MLSDRPLVFAGRRSAQFSHVVGVTYASSFQAQLAILLFNVDATRRFPHVAPECIENANSHQTITLIAHQVRRAGNQRRWAKDSRASSSRIILSADGSTCTSITRSLYRWNR